MKQGESLARSTRLTQIQHFLHRNPRGLTTHELAELCGVCVRTIQRDLVTLQCDLRIPLTQEGDRYGIIDSYILPPVSFSLYEAMALFLASRLVLRQTDECNPHIKASLNKISTVLPAPLRERLRQTAKSIERKPANADAVHIFEQVAIAWSVQRKMRITYHSLQSTEEKEWLLEPYFVEMTGVGYSTYVIGRGIRNDRDQITTFKLDRIRKAEILDEGFEIPPGLDFEKRLSSSWGIIWGDDVEIKLKFSPSVTRRVKETAWHSSLSIGDLPDGGCIVKLKVSSLMEVTPWIRGWGLDVEVLEPESFRSEFRDAAGVLSRIYGSK